MLTVYHPYFWYKNLLCDIKKLFFSFAFPLYFILSLEILVYSPLNKVIQKILRKIRKQKPDCSCRLTKKYLENTGFVGKVNFSTIELVYSKIYSMLLLIFIISMFVLAYLQFNIKSIFVNVLMVKLIGNLIERKNKRIQRSIWNTTEKVLLQLYIFVLLDMSLTNIAQSKTIMRI